MRGEEHESNLLLLSGSELARRIRAGELTSERAVGAHIQAIRRVNPGLNAVVATRFDEALEEARAVDASLARGHASPGVFLGVPCTIKESFALTGMPHSSGLVARAETVATKDATAVRRLREAGAIPLGVTNISELCMWMESHNQLYGRTNNPYHPDHIAGGSSGGEGAIVGAGASPMGLGADIGGSIRMPAFFCGVFGHKPTGGLVPGTGQFPIAENEALRFLTTGPIARRAVDLFPFLQVVAGPDDEDRGSLDMSLGDPSAVSLHGMRVLDVRGNGAVKVSDALLAAQARVASKMRREGAEVRTARIRGLRRSLEVWSANLEAAATTSFGTHLGNGVPIAPGREFVRWLRGRSEHTLPALGLAALERLPLLKGAGAARAIAHGHALRDELEDLIGDGVMLYPSYASVAPRHSRPLFTPWQWVYTAIMNVLELPVTQVPLGLDANGLPLGVQVVGRRGNDHVTIAVAGVLERLFGGWQPPARFAEFNGLHDAWMTDKSMGGRASGPRQG